MTPQARQWLGLHLVESLGPRHGRRLLDHFGTVVEVCRASHRALAEVAGLPGAVADAIVHRDPRVLERELAAAARYGAQILCLEDDVYPPLLREIPDAPLCLYVLGDVSIMQRTALAIVGSRHCSAYGREQAYAFAMALARCGMVVVSGLARGIDARAHAAALDCGGLTLGVLGCGLGHLAEHANARLAEHITTRRGAVVTEFEIATPASKTTFPRRNRIIAGLAAGTLVVEAAERSGALITAGYTLDYNRELFAIPGSLGRPTAEGTNRLIQRGCAKLVARAQDILEELNHVAAQLRCDYQEHAKRTLSAATLDPTQRQVLAAIDAAGTDLASILRTCGLPPEVIAHALLTMQLEGVVEQLPGNRYAALVVPDA